MKSEGHQEIYRLALESAKSEFTEITAAVEKLRARKEQLERLLIVLKPILGEEEQASSDVPPTSQSFEQREQAPEKPDEESSQPEPFTADPFQRRIDHVLGIGAGIRDVRKYSRQF
jgi:hypothetical protein